MCERKQHVVIIGSGLGGLSCGAILAKNGYRVTVVEQSHQVGGCLQCFTRQGAKFETGMHFVGSAEKGQTLDKLMRYLEIDKEVRLAPLDPTGYDLIALGGKVYRFAKGRTAFIEQMCRHFPHQRLALERLFDLIGQVANASSMHSLKDAETDRAVTTAYQLRSVDEVLDEVITDPLLAKVLAGNLPLYAGERGKTPFSTYAFIMDFYNQSAFRFVGGSDTVAHALVRTIERYGGVVRTRQRASHIVCDSTHATGVELNGKGMLLADYVLSDAHPIRTLELVGDGRGIRPAFRKRIQSIPQTVGGFSVYLRFKPGVVPYLNSNYYGYQGDTPWGCEHYTPEEWPKGFLYMHFCSEEEPTYASSGVILSYMQMSEVEAWKGTKVGHRGADYEQFKRQHAERLIDAVAQHFPDIRHQIADYYTSTPLTYLDYTGTEAGSMYGNAKDIHMGAAYRVPQRTKVPNLFLTGQNINSHGMLGVLVGTIVTCSEFLTAKTIYEQINAANE